MSPQLAIVIPTRNRQQYCLESVKQMLSVCDAHCEIIIHDNSDASYLAKQIEQLADNRIKYFYEDTQLSFVENFSRAVQQAEADYICVLGDDDGILPTALHAVEAMKQHGLDAFVPGLNAVYHWPSKVPIVKSAEGGYLNLNYLKYNSRIFDLESGLRKLMASAGQNYQAQELPRLYHGIIKRDCLENIRNRTGHYFGGLTPDIYMAVALANVCEKVVGINVPITISGISPKSGSAQSATGEHTGMLSDAPHFRGNAGYEWAKQVPEFYSVETIWADSTLQALKDFHRDELISTFDIARLDAVADMKYPQFAKIIRNHAKNSGVSRGGIARNKVWYLYDKYVKRIVRRATRRKGDVFKYYGVPDLETAANIIMTKVDVEKYVASLEVVNK